MSELSVSAIESALDLQSRNYRLLRWLENALARHLVTPETAGGHGSGMDGAQEWLETHFDDLPEDVRGDRESLWRLAGFFTSSIEGTFELEAQPGTVLYSEDNHCFCPACSFMVQKPRLRPRQVTATDKKVAREMMEEHLRSLWNENGRTADAEQLGALLGDRPTQEDVALLTYVADLQERAYARIQGAAPLALWRIFAWTPSGSPAKDFEPTAKRVVAAQERVLTKLPPPATP